MIQIDGVAKFYGDRTLFTELSWQLGQGSRIGLIGPNGAGKTTLFRLLAAELEPDAGRVVIPKGWTVGLLPQEVDTLEDRALLDVVLSGKAELVAIEARLAEILATIDEARHHPDSAETIEALAHEHAELHERFEHGDGYRLRPRALEILGGMGFKPGEESRSAAELSGGWRMRLLLSKLLFQRPNVLLMDEPTNHLDLPSLEWLEGFLQGYEGTVVVISHDRYFLNRLVNEIAAFDVDGFQTYTGDYDKYVAMRELQLEQLRSQKSQQDRKLKETERFIERFRYKASKSRQVQSRVKQLEKVDRIELPGQRKQVHFRFAEGVRPGKVVAHFEHVAKRYGKKTVYENLDLQILRDERVALVGPNGEGKSTLLKILAGEIQTDGGRFEPGHNVAVGYFAQHQIDVLDVSNTLLEELEAHASLETRPNCRSILGAFLFSGDEVSKKISVLSGGEKSRVALAKLLLRPTNVLLLDEPTNHLDMQARDVLLQALATYNGTIVFVSHDRLFINGLATRVLHVEGGECLNYPGNYEYYHEKRLRDASRGQSGPEPEARTKDPTPDDSDTEGLSREARKAEKRREAQLRNEMHRRTGGLRTRLKSTEVEVAEREETLASLEVQMADPALYDDPNRSQAVLKEHAVVKARLAELYEQWAEFATRIEGIEDELAVEPE